MRYLPPRLKRLLAGQRWNIILAFVLAFLACGICGGAAWDVVTRLAWAVFVCPGDPGAAVC